MQVDVAFDAREIEDSRQIERIIHIQVNPEERFVAHRIKLPVKRPVIFVVQFRGFAYPCRLSVVNDLILVRIDVLTVFPLLLLSEDDGDGQITAIFVQQRGDLALLEKFLVFVVDK